MISVCVRVSSILRPHPVFAKGGVVTYHPAFKLRPTHVFDLDRKRTAAGGDLVYAIEVCSPNDDYDCLFFLDFALSVPRKGVPNGTTWRIGKFRFVAVDGGPMTVGGRELSATIIDTIVDGAPGDRASIRALYDRRFGIVAWASLLWETNPTTNVVNFYPTIVDPVFATDLGLWGRQD
jgi:hypothetical protein